MYPYSSIGHGGVAHLQARCGRTPRVGHDLIFRALMKGNNLDINSIFDENSSIKDEVKAEAITSINWCRENIKLSIPKLTNLSKEELDEKKLEELTETFPKFYLHTLETIRRGE